MEMLDIPFNNMAWKDVVTEGKKPKGSRIFGFGEEGADLLNVPTARHSCTPKSTVPSASEKEKDEKIEKLERNQEIILATLAKYQEKFELFRQSQSPNPNSMQPISDRASCTPIENSNSDGQIP